MWEYESSDFSLMAASFSCMDLLSPDFKTILSAFGLEAGDASLLGNGLINRTFLIREPNEQYAVLQQVNRIFSPAINETIDAVTRHLAAKGLVTPGLRRTNAGDCYFEHAGAIWRALTYIEGVSHDLLENGRQAAGAGITLARFHRSVADLQYEFGNQRSGVHDTAKHLAALHLALDEHKDHSHYEVIAGLADQILAFAEALPVLPDVPERIVHGDPKISNFLFARESDEPICMIDFDTISVMQLPLELGDAFRSWCNPEGEDSAMGVFSLDLFEPAVNAYLSETSGWIRQEESASIVLATQTILIELAARFCADALNESYFRWDPERFPGHSEHNQIRAAGQLAAAQSLTNQKIQAEKIVVQATT